MWILNRFEENILENLEYNESRLVLYICVIYVCVCVCVCIYVYVYIYTHTHISKS